jgi:membrane-associated phospholipid phosphatase
VLAAAMAVRVLLPRGRKLIFAYFIYAALVAVATFYGRYHYLVDAVGGVVVGVFATPLGMWLSRAREPEWAEVHEKQLRLAASGDFAWPVPASNTSPSN